MVAPLFYKGEKVSSREWDWPREDEADWPEYWHQLLIGRLVECSEAHREKNVVCPWTSANIVNQGDCRICEDKFGDRKYGYSIRVGLGLIDAKFKYEERDL
jgi:hypothetical protein